MKIPHLFHSEEPSAGDTGSAAPIAPPEAQLSDVAIAKIVESLKAEMAGKAAAPAPDPTPTPSEPTPTPSEPTPDPRDATMRSLLIKANAVPDTLTALIPANPTEAQALIESEHFQGLIQRERSAATVQAPDPNAPKPAAQQGEANNVPVKPKTFAALTIDHKIQVDNALKGIF